MANIQAQFEQFHATARVDYETSEPLREKRDILVEKIRSYMTANGHVVCSPLLQGSYKMKTGVKPIEDLEYDIDVGLRFGIDPSDFTASDVRGWVLKAVEGHTDRVEDKPSCIRVGYKAGYHVDLVTYATWEDAVGDTQFNLGTKAAGWRPADPPGLLDFLKEARVPFAELTDNMTKTDQFRRSVRYLRRWSDFQVPREDRSKPSGLAFVVLAAQHLAPRTRLSGAPHDLQALLTILDSVLAVSGAIPAPKPTPEYEDLLGHLTEKQMEALRDRLKKLREALQYADEEPDPVDACERMVSVFGPDFPIPDPDDTGTKTVAPAVVPSSSSAQLGRD